jgi:hypothetical protein
MKIKLVVFGALLVATLSFACADAPRDYGGYGYPSYGYGYHPHSYGYGYSPFYRDGFGAERFRGFHGERYHGYEYHGGGFRGGGFQGGGHH